MLGLFYQSSFQVPDVRFRQVLILAREEDDLVPEVLVEMALHPVAHRLGFPDLDGARSALSIKPS
jgi:hypothetical protein